MTINSERDVTPENVKKLREQLKLSQSDFWDAVGVEQSPGCRYEAAQHKIPRPVRMLIYANYVVGIPVNQISTGQKNNTPAAQENGG